jgi:hypothetical protein
LESHIKTLPLRLGERVGTLLHLVIDVHNHRSAARCLHDP